MRFLKLAGAGLIIHIAGSQFALAAEWRFCIAPSDRGNKMLSGDGPLKSRVVSTAPLQV
jgi:hypothetical protein